MNTRASGSFAMVSLAVVALVSCGPRPRAQDSSQTGESVAHPDRSIGRVERLHPALDAIVASDATFEILAEGHEWTEGPVWVRALTAVLYSDIPNNAIYRWSESDGATLWLSPSGYTADVPRGGESGSNGLVIDARGQLVLAQHGDRRIARLTSPLTGPRPEFTTLTDRYHGRRYNSPNDVAIHSSGGIYFTDPPYGLEHGADDPAKELNVNGVYRLAPDGSVTLLIDDLSRPNGVVFSPDERTLYVSNSDPAQPVIRAYNVAPDGSISNGRVFFDYWGDGMAVDTAGNVYVTAGERGVLVISPDGTHLGTLVTTERTSNCTFGEDGRSLFVTSDMYVVRIRLNVRGFV